MLREIKNNTLYFDGCNTVELAEKFGTPLYVFSETEMVNRLDEIKECFIKPYPKNRIAYAAKAFFTLAIAKLMEREDVCIDVVSGGELYTAMKANFPAEKIEFNGNNKSREEIEMAVDYGIGRIIIDGLQELSLIEDVCREKGRHMNVLYRITPGVKSDSHDYIVTGKKDSKFGIPLDDDVVLPCVKDAIDSEYVSLLGLHFHVGSQLFDNASHIQALNVALELTAKVKKQFGYDFSEINIGGGFGITYTDEERKSYGYFLEPIMARVKEFYAELGAELPAVVIEPGRSIVGESGMSLYEIGSIKDIKGVRKYVSVNGGMGDNIRPALYEAKYTGVIANKAGDESSETVTISGKCCESGDVLIRDIKLPKAEAGDIFAIFSTGAYGYSMANNYNKNTIPGVVLVKDGKAEWIVRPQSYDDLIKNEIIPSSL